MANAIINAAPQTNFLGTQDNSTRQPVPVPESLPTHLAKVYLYAQTGPGPNAPQLVGGDSMTQMYGVDTFDYLKSYANHQTVLANTLDDAANQMMIERVIPLDAAPPANLRVYLDVLATTVTDYQRNTDGSIKVDSTGAPVPVVGAAGQIAGFTAKFVTAYIAPDEDGNTQIGLGTILPGDQTTTGQTPAQSMRYPLFDLAVPHIGAEGNWHGFRMWAPTQQSSTPIDDTILTNELVYPFRFAFANKTTGNGTPSIVAGQDGSQYYDLTFKPNTIDTSTTQQLYIGDRLIQAYQNLNDPTGLPPQWGPFGTLFTYDDNIALLINEFYAAEFPYADSFSDFTGAVGEEFLFNFVSAVSSQNSPYHSYQLVTATANATRFTENTTVFASGGTDGTMNDVSFAALVSTAVLQYADPNSYLQDLATYPESIIYDTGFPLQTKYDLCSFIAVRFDTAVVLATHDDSQPALTAAQDSALAIALRTRLQLFPESDYFGTATMRGVIVGRSGTLLSSLYTKRLPLSIELASKAAAYMGSGDGVWKNVFSFDQDPLNQVTLFTDISVTFTPATVRNQDWDNGLVWVEAYSRRSYYFPAFKTVYDNDTSVLTSFFTMMACVELEKVGDRVRRKFSGNSKLTPTQLVDRVNKEAVAQTNQRFDGRFTIQPNTFFTDADTQRGYSWTLMLKIFAPNMYTVATLIIQANRISDLTTTAGTVTTTAT